ncbi:hypothetical protein DFJ73DRAFT_896976 [Zopfochytrium polystomum]|nr:hypothetical protein DFJ73DRAFT_896976 [Zopfochytrium polystomum]
MSGGQIETITLRDPYADVRAAIERDSSNVDIPLFDEPVLVISRGMGGDLDLAADGGAGARGVFLGEARERLFPLAKPFANMTDWIGQQLEVLLTANATRPGSAGSLAAAKAAARATAATPGGWATADAYADGSGDRLHRRSTTASSAGAGSRLRTTKRRSKRTARSRPVFTPPAQQTRPELSAPGTVSCGHASSTALTCDVLAWATNPTGRVRADLMHRGFIVLTSAVAHYVLNQASYDGSATGTCTYFGNQGRGIVSAPGWIRAVVAAALAVASLAAGVVVVSFFVVVAAGGASQHVALAAAMLDDPLRMLYYLRGSLSRVIERGMRKGVADGGRPQLRMFLQDFMVRFGEAKSHRGEEVGRLALDVPSNVIRLRKDRAYE